MDWYKVACKGGRLSLKMFLAAGCILMMGSADGKVSNGLEVFLEQHVDLVKGKRVGLLTNQTGVNSNKQASVDLFKANPKINLQVLFAPEHGIRGDIKAGENFGNTRDPKTGLIVYSLHGGKDHRPTKEALDKIDVLIYNIQDIGCRSYTYIWHMAECMRACAAAGKPFIVLDVPNPMGAVTADGPIIENKYRSFIGLYPIPYCYGLTAGELARYLNKEHNINCKLYVVPMVNYRRDMNWADTGLPWVPTSPNVPTSRSAQGYCMTGTIGTLGQTNIGLGFAPFEIIAAPWIDSEHMATYLTAQHIPGIRFIPFNYVPAKGFMAGKLIHGVKLSVTDTNCRPIVATIAILCYLQKYYSKDFKWQPEKFNGFDKAIGTAKVREMVMAGENYKTIVAAWDKPLSNFRARAAQYKIYK